MKMRRPHQVPLPPQALTLLDELHPLTGRTGFLFPAQSTRPVSMSENTLNQALRRMGFSGDEMTSHGFRASFATIANESGLWNPDAIERSLAHVDGNAVRRVYVRGAYWDERVKLAAWWADFLDQCRGPRDC
jgi:integrase